MENRSVATCRVGGRAEEGPGDWVTVPVRLVDVEELEGWANLVVGQGPGEVAALVPADVWQEVSGRGEWRAEVELVAPRRIRVVRVVSGGE